MKISAVHHTRGNAIKISGINSELVITTSMGPRILSLKHKGGENLLYEDQTGFGVDEWCLYGGHRFTIAPETEKSYYPDNSPCKVGISDKRLRISAPVRKDGIRLSMEVSTSNSFEGFEILHHLENLGTTNWSGALWAITCIPRCFNIFASCKTDRIQYWPGANPENWDQSGGLITVRPGDFREKIGWFEAGGWLSASGGKSTLKIHNTGKAEAADCVDGGCNLEIFVCRHWTELETLGSVLNVPPGASATHLQYWELTDEPND